MPMLRSLGLLLCFAFPVLAQETKPSEDGFRPIFDGKSLEGWKGRTDLWSVEDGTITGRTTAENPLKANTFLIWQGGEPADFELRAQFKIQGGNSGIQYRSRVIDANEFIVGGYQADIDDSLTYAGILYEERGRGILAVRGQKVTISGTKEKKRGSKETVTFGEADALGKVIKKGEWNDYRIVADKNHLQHFINDTLVTEVIDEQADAAATKGVIALQIHVGPPMVIQYKNLRIKELGK